jgi:hypothetical protein
MDMEHFDQIPCISHKIMRGHTRGKLLVHEELLSDAPIEEADVKNLGR